MNSKHTAAHFFLEGLVDLGVEYIFANLGTDHVSLIEGTRALERDDAKQPNALHLLRNFHSCRAF